MGLSVDEDEGIVLLHREYPCCGRTSRFETYQSVYERTCTKCQLPRLDRPDRKARPKFRVRRTPGSRYIEEKLGGRRVDKLTWERIR